MCIPDSLDLILSSVYNHETQLFINKNDTVLQLENAKINPIKEKMIKDLNEMRKNYIHHPLILGECLSLYSVSICIMWTVLLIKISSFMLGGLLEKKSTHSIKLSCIGQHTPITNPGYSRQPVDGNIFNY